MMLLLDVGNSRVKWRIDAGSEEGKCLSGVVAHDQAVALADVWRQATVSVASMAVTSVSGDVLVDGLCESARAVWGDIPCYVARTQAEMHSLRFCYADPSRLGVDRALAMIAGYDLLQDGFVLIDSGSALTADYVSVDGEHLGGFIVPGLQMSASTLLRGTSRVRLEHVCTESAGLGCSTEECVNKGIYRMFASTIQAFAREGELRGLSHILVAGGDAPVVSEVLATARVEQGLVLDGLKLWVCDQMARGAQL